MISNAHAISLSPHLVKFNALFCLEIARQMYLSLSGMESDSRSSLVCR